MQRGHVAKHRQNWVVRYYAFVYDETKGRPVRKLKNHKIGPISSFTKTQALVEAEKLLAPINANLIPPDAAMPVAVFIEKHYLPHCERELRHSTVEDYKDIFRLHLKTRLNIPMKDFQTSHGQRLFRDIALSKDLSHKRMLRIRAFLSGCFRFAKQEGIINHPNPIPDTSVKGRTKTGFVPQAYSLDEIFQVFKILARRDFIVVATAAFTGLRLSELRGLRWRDHRDGKLFVERSVVGTKTGATKTEESQAPVPLVPILDEVLTTYRTWQKKFAGDHDPIFAGERRGNPLNMHNLANRSIKAKFKAAGILWKGWHAFRRGLSTNLAALGVPPKIAAGILRHSSVQTTLQFYVVSNEPESVAALQKIQDATWGKFGETQDVPQSGSQVRVNNEK